MTKDAFQSIGQDIDTLLHEKKLIDVVADTVQGLYHAITDLPKEGVEGNKVVAELQGDRAELVQHEKAKIVDSVAIVAEVAGAAKIIKLLPDGGGKDSPSNVASDSGAVPGGSVVSNSARVNPIEIGFSQNTVSASKKRFDASTGESTTYTFDEIVTSMKSDGWQGAPLNVVKMPDGSLTSIDNTRLLAARHAGIDAEIVVHEYGSKIPSQFAKDYTTKGFETPNTWGDAIQNRIYDQKQKYFQDRQFYEKFEYGTIYDPKLIIKGQK